MEASDIRKLKKTLAALCDYVAGIRVSAFDEPYRNFRVENGRRAIELLSKESEDENSAKDNVTAGNMAECRSALEAIADIARTDSISTLPSAKLVLLTCEKALAAPARNCERYATLESALAAWREQPPSVGPFDNWLFDYAKESEVAK